MTREYRVELSNPAGVVLTQINCASHELAEAWGEHFFGHGRCSWVVQSRFVTPWADDGPRRRTVTTVEMVETSGHPAESAQGED